MSSRRKSSSAIAPHDDDHSFVSKKKIDRMQMEQNVRRNEFLRSLDEGSSQRHESLAIVQRLQEMLSRESSSREHDFNEVVDGFVDYLVHNGGAERIHAKTTANQKRQKGEESQQGEDETKIGSARATVDNAMQTDSLDKTRVPTITKSKLQANVDALILRRSMEQLLLDRSQSHFGNSLRMLLEKFSAASTKNTGASAPAMTNADRWKNEHFTMFPPRDPRIEVLRGKNMIKRRVRPLHTCNVFFANGRNGKASANCKRCAGHYETQYVIPKERLLARAGRRQRAARESLSHMNATNYDNDGGDIDARSQTYSQRTRAGSESEQYRMYQGDEYSDDEPDEEGYTDDWDQNATDSRALIKQLLMNSIGTISTSSERCGNQCNSDEKQKQLSRDACGTISHSQTPQDSTTTATSAHDPCIVESDLGLDFEESGAPLYYDYSLHCMDYADGVRSSPRVTVFDRR